MKQNVKITYENPPANLLVGVLVFSATMLLTANPLNMGNSSALHITIF